ncbi:MAG TPA: response regulator transcription factor [Gaiellaceae bacterium]|nr:response regulator transcription factor [Gaiellaceae bacterium]
MTRPRVLVADALPIVRAGVRDLLQRDGGFDVTEAATVEQLLAAAERDRPDLCLVDLDLPPSGGCTAVRQLARASSTAAIVWSFDPTPEVVLAAVRAGAHGFLHKAISQQGLVRALRGAARGEAPLQRDLASMMIEAIHGHDERADARGRVALLSLREREVLELVAGGARNKDVAAVLAISEFTVKRHVQNILQKLALPTRGAAALFYRAAVVEEPSVVERIA